ncbi:MAG: autotransporter domain-containing protein [Planctomycetaceae bacterium]|jgi:hypothetical protein|nr:autotransporter domain-containing protein [Planctomycetaceae bacterium]
MKSQIKKYFNQFQHIITIIALVILIVLLSGLLCDYGKIFAAEPLSLYGSPAPVKPQRSDGYSLYGIDDNSELLQVLEDVSVLKKWIKLEDNVFVPATERFQLLDGEDLVIELGMYNLQTDSNFYFDSNKPSKVTIIGSTMLANGGLQMHGETTLNYFGTYSSGRADVLASSVSDNVTINLTGVNSRWDATNTIPKFINILPTATTNYESGTIIIGDGGKAAVNITSGNDVDSGEVIIGAQAGSAGVLNLSGVYEIDDIYNRNKTIKKATTWHNSGTFYIGYSGDGVVNIDYGAVLKTGSIGVGIDGAGNGVLNVTGLGNFIDKTRSNNFLISHGSPLNSRDRDFIVESAYYNTDATRVYIYGRDDEVKQPNDKHGGFLDSSGGRDTLKSIGDGVMNISKGAIIIFNETDSVSGEPSNYTSKITLGKGDSFVDNSIIIGVKDAAHGDIDNAGNVDTNRFDDAGLIDGTDLSGALQANSLTFRNNAVLQGNLKIHMGKNTFSSGSILTPGFGSYHLHLPSSDLVEHEKFGRVEFKNDIFTHDSAAATIIDFGVHGDQNYGSNPSLQTAYPSAGDNFGYANNDYYCGRDLVVVDGDAALAGDVFFRPQTGYYSDKTSVDFMRVTGTINGQYERLHLYPYRWFNNPQLLKDNQMNMFVADRNMRPFTNVASSVNLRGVGGALDNIYNAQSNPKWLPVLDWFWLMNDEQMREAERLLSGEIRAAAFYMPLRSAWKFGFDRVNWSDAGRKVYFGQQNKSCNQKQKNALWATSYFDYQSIDDDHNVSSMATQRVSMMLGYDRVLPECCNLWFISDAAAGVLFSYSQPKLDQAGGRVIADDYLAGVYLAARIYSAYELKSWLGIGAQHYNLRRDVPIVDQVSGLKATFTGNSASGSIQVARPLKWRNLTLRPHIGLDMNFVKLNQGLDDFTGDVMEQVALCYHGSDWFQGFGRGGLRLDFGRNYCGHLCNLSATLGYSYLLFGDQAPESVHEFAYAGGGKFKILGNNISRSFVNVDIGTQIFLNKNKNKMIYLQYNSNYGKYTNAHTAAIGYQFLF